MKSIRFWHYGNGPVLLTLKAGQRLHHSSGGRTDEGWSHESNVWSFDGHVVTCEWCNDGVDCDGQLTSEGLAWFSARDAKAGYRDDRLGINFPLWRQSRLSQRDYAAEAMNY